MNKEHFTIDQVNELIPQLEYHFRKMLHHKREMARATRKLRKWGAAPLLIGRIPQHARPEIQALQAEIRGHYREFKQHLFAMENMGGEIKDLELGRVDFPSQREGEAVSLSWQLGVTAAAVILPPEERKKSIPYTDAPPVFSSPPNSLNYQ
jgi:hypothetical protein